MPPLFFSVVVDLARSFYAIREQQQYKRILLIEQMNKLINSYSYKNVVVKYIYFFIYADVAGAYSFILNVTALNAG